MLVKKTTILDTEKNIKNDIEKTIETNQNVTIVQLQLLRSSSREFGGGGGNGRILLSVLERNKQDHFSTRFKNSEGSWEETETGFLKLVFSFLVCLEFNLINN